MYYCQYGYASTVVPCSYATPSYTIFPATLIKYFELGPKKLELSYFLLFPPSYAIFFPPSCAIFFFLAQLHYPLCFRGGKNVKIA